MMPHELKIPVPGFTIAFKTWPVQGAKPVLCLHGKMDNAASFDLIAPHLSHLNLAAVDYPGTGFSTWYPPGIVPYWKNDALLLMHAIEALGWQEFDIIAHSLGGLLASFLAIALPEQVGKIVLLDILGPTTNFIENGIKYMQRDIETYLTYEQHKRTLYPTQESAIEVRMQSGNISHQAAKALVERGTVQTKEGWVWTFDPRLRCISTTVPYEDELRTMFRAINSPVCLIRAKNGVPYPEAIFQERTHCIKQFTLHEVAGGHHVHMDDPLPVAKLISQFFEK